MAADIRKPLRFTTHQALPQRLILSTLTGRPVHISKIRPSSLYNPGLAVHEISFLRLIEAVTNGSHFEISYTGTTLFYRPGLITGSTPSSSAQGGAIRHELPESCTRGISYFLIPLCLLAPFSKAQFNVIFTGPGVITSATQTGDISADSVRTAILPLYARFGISNNIELRILRRSNPGPRGIGGAGEIQLVFGHQERLPKTIHLLNPGQVQKIRGVAYSTGVSATNNARMIEAARGVLNPMAGDIYIYSEVSAAHFLRSADTSNIGIAKIGLGFGLSLVAESSTRVLCSTDVACPPSGGQTPEDIGHQCAFQLLDTLSCGGTVSLTAAPTVLTLMAMGLEDVGRLRMGREILATEEIIGLGRDLRAFGASGWRIRDDATGMGGEVIVSVVGRGIVSIGRRMI